MIAGLDISTTCTGLTIINDKKIPIFVDYYKLDKFDGLFDKADYLIDKLVYMFIKYGVRDIVIEAPLEIAKGTNAKSAVMLNRFNYIIS